MIKVNDTLKRFINYKKIAVLIENNTNYLTLQQADDHIKEKLLELEFKRDIKYNLNIDIYFNNTLGIDCLKKSILIEYRTDTKNNHFGIIRRLKADIDTFHSFEENKKYFEFNRNEKTEDLKKAGYIIEIFENEILKNLPEEKNFNSELEKGILEKNDIIIDKEESFFENYSFYTVTLLSSVNKIIKKDNFKILYYCFAKFDGKRYKCIFKKETYKYIKFLKVKSDFNFYGCIINDIFIIEKIVSIKGKKVKEFALLSDKISFLKNKNR